jgi:hypothetical protein
MMHQLLAARLLAELDPVIDSIRYDPARVTAILRTIRQAESQSEQRFASPKGRWDFLEAARRYLAPVSDREELLVAFGTQGGTSRNSRSRLLTITRIVGVDRRLELPEPLLAELRHVAVTPKAEAILVHNHPPFWMRHLAAEFGLWLPTASDADRDVSFAYEVKALAASITNGAGGRLRWYVVDEGAIREFRLPSWSRITNLLTTAGRQ